MMAGELNFRSQIFNLGNHFIRQREKQAANLEKSLG